MQTDTTWLDSLPASGDLPPNDRTKLQGIYDRCRQQLWGIEREMPRIDICKQACNSKPKLDEILVVIASTRMMLNLIARLP